MCIVKARILALSLIIAIFSNQAYSSSLDDQQDNETLTPDTMIGSNKNLPPGNFHPKASGLSLHNYKFAVIKRFGAAHGDTIAGL